MDPDYNEDSDYGPDLDDSEVDEDCDEDCEDDGQPSDLQENEDFAQDNLPEYSDSMYEDRFDIGDGYDGE